MLDRVLFPLNQASASISKKHRISASWWLSRHFRSASSSTPPRRHRGIPFLPQRSRGTVKPGSRCACKDYVCANDGHKRNKVSTSSAGWSHSGKTHSPEVAPTRACRRTPSSPPQARDHLGAIAIRPIGARGLAYRGLAVVARAVGGNLGRCRFIGFGCAGIITKPSGEEFTVEVRGVPSTMSSTPARYRHRSRRPAIGIPGADSRADVVRPAKPGDVVVIRLQPLGEHPDTRPKRGGQQQPHR